MEVSVEVHKIIKCAYNTVFFPAGGGVDDMLVRLSLIKPIIEYVNFDVPFIQCQISTYILGIVNEFVQYVQNYFQYLYLPIYPTTGDKNISKKS